MGGRLERRCEIFGQDGWREGSGRRKIGWLSWVGVELAFYGRVLINGC